jgi:hypothetical protein
MTIASKSVSAVKAGAAKEPVAFPSLILSLVTAVLALLVGSDVIDASSSSLIFGAIAAAIPLVAVLIQRPKVTPVANATDD